MSKYETTIGVMTGNLERFQLGLKWKSPCLDGLLTMVRVVLSGWSSQLSRFPKPRQLNAARPCEPLGPQGHEPEGDGAEFTA